jgi:hypothetical protein
MDCKTVRKNLAAFLDKEINQELTKSVSEHLDSCPSCSREVDLLRETWSLLDKYPAIPYNPGNIKAKIESIKNSRFSFFGRIGKWQKIAVIAAGIILVIGSAIYVYFADYAKVNNQSARPVIAVKADSVSEYYSELLSYYDSIKDEDYWKEDDVKKMSPYLFSNEELF